MEKNEIISLLEEFSNKNANPYNDGLKSCKYNEKLNFGSGEFKGFYSEGWAVGGMTGGNCWNDGVNRRIEVEEEKSIELLTKFLEENFSQLTYADFKRIEKKIDTYDYGTNEYYGNYVDYRMSYITFEDIAEVISGFNLLLSSEGKYKI